MKTIIVIYKIYSTSILLLNPLPISTKPKLPNPPNKKTT